MKINIRANQLVDGEISFISLVKNGANRSPFKIVKAEGPAPTVEDALANIANAIAKIEKTSNEINQNLRKDDMNLKDAPAAFAATLVGKEDRDIRVREIAGLRHKLAGLNDQQQNLWERPNTPAFQKFDDDLTYQIERAESELRLLISDEEQMNRSSAFFFRGGISNYARATISDSANEQRAAAIHKAESQIDLSDNGLNPLTDPEEVAKIDLGAFSL